MLNLEGLNKLALCLLLLDEADQLIEAMNNIVNFISKNGPFKNIELKCLTSNNMKHFNGDLYY